MKILFFVLIVFWFVSSSLAFQLPQEAIDAVQNSAIASLSNELSRVNVDIRTLTIVVNDLSAAINRFTGIGIAVGAIGGVIVILQALQIRKRQ